MERRLTAGPLASLLTSCELQISGGSRILKGGGVPLSRMFSTALVHAHEAGDAGSQNDKKGGSAELKEPPGSATADEPSMKDTPNKGNGLTLSCPKRSLLYISVWYIYNSKERTASV